MKKIVLFPALELPLPAVKGGAIETLLDILISENEKYGCFEFYVVSIYDKRAYQLSKKYKKTKFIYIYDALFDSFFMFSYKVIRRMFNLHFLCLNRQYKRAFNELKKIKPDYIICEGGYYDDFKNISKYFGKEKLILHIHHDYEPNNKVVSYFKYFIGISNFLMQKWQEKYLNIDQKMYLLKNCIELDKFTEMLSEKDLIRKQIRNKHNIPEDYFVYVFVGRIIQEKGIIQLIQAFKLLHQNKKNVKLLIIGGYDNKSRIGKSFFEKFKKEINDVNFIDYIGYIDNCDIYKYYYASNVAVFPSICEEAAGLVAIEAMACEIPIIITKSGGMVEYATEQYALHISKDKNLMDELLNSMEDLYNHKVELQKATNYVENFGKEKYYESFKKIIYEIDS